MSRNGDVCDEAYSVDLCVDLGRCRPCLVLAGVFLAGVWAGLGAQDSKVAVFLRDTCGYKPEVARENKVPFELVDLANLARVSAVMNGGSNLKLSSAILDLRMFWTKEKIGDPAAEARADEMSQDIGDQIDAMVVRAARCGAAYGIVSKGG